MSSTTPLTRLTTKGAQTRFDRWIAKAREGLEEVLFLMAKDTSGHTRWSVFGMWFDFFQLVAYPLYGGDSFPWAEMPVMQWFIALLAFLNPSVAADTISPAFRLALVFAGAGWIALIVTAAIYSAYSFSQHNFSTLLPLRFLRATAKLTTTALFVPLASLLIGVYKCKKGETWSVADFPCYGTEHNLIMAMVSILLPCFWIFSLCVSAVFFDRNYRSNNITARAHGRVAILMISIKSTLTLIFTAAGDADPWFLHIFVILLGVVWTWLWLRFLPHFTQWMNQIWASFGAVFVWASLCAALARLLNNPQAGVAGYVFFIGVPTAAYTGYALAYMRFQSFARVGQQGGTIMRNAFDVELRARYILRDVMTQSRMTEGNAHHRSVHTNRVSVVDLGATQKRMARTGELSSGASDFRATARSSSMAVTGTRASGAASASATTPRGQGQRSVRAGGAGGSSTPGLPPRNSSKSGSNSGTGTGAGAGSASSRKAAAAAAAASPSARSRSLSPRAAAASPRAGGATANFSSTSTSAMRNTGYGGNSGYGNNTGSYGPAATSRSSRQQEEEQDYSRGGGSHTQRPGAAIGSRSVRGRKMGITAAEEAAAIAQVEELYRQAAHIFPNSAVLDVMRAQFYRDFVHDRDAEMAIVENGLKKDAGVDIRFLLKQSQKQLEDSAGSGSGGKMTKIDEIQSKKLQKDSEDLGLKAREHEQAFWQELRAPSPELNKLHALSEAMSAAIADATNSFEKLLQMQPENPDALDNYAVFLLEVKRETDAADKYFEQAAEIRSAQEAARAAHLAELQAAQLKQAEAVAAAAQAAAQGKGGAAAMLSGASRGRAHGATGAMNTLREAFRLGAFTSGVAASGVPTSVTQRTNTGGSRGGSLVYSGAGGASAGGSTTNITNITPGAAMAVTAFLSTAAASAAAARASHGADGAAAIANRRGSAAVAAYSSAVAKVRRASIAMAAAEGMKKGASRSDSTSVTSARRTERGGATSTASGASGRRSSSTPANRRSSSGVRADMARADADIARARMKAEEELQREQQQRDEASRRYGPQAGTELADVAKRTNSKTRMRNREEMKRAAEEAEAEDKARRLQRVSTRARMEARMRRKDAAESAASSLRMTIHGKANQPEPSLALLVRAITFFFVVSAAIDIAAAAVHRWLLTGYQDNIHMLRLSTERQLMVEDCVHSANTLVLMNGGRLTYDADLVNYTYTHLQASASRLDELHRQLYLATSEALPEETSLYNSAVLPTDDLVLDLRPAAIAAAAARGDPAPPHTLTTRYVSFSNLIIEYFSKVNLMVNLPLSNMTEWHPTVWYVLHNGPGIVRSAANTSTLLLSERAADHEEKVRNVDYAIMLAACILFGGVSVIVVLPIVLLVKRHTDEIFAIFLNLPDTILEDMENTCKQRLQALEKLKEENAGALEDAALKLAMSTAAGPTKTGGSMVSNTLGGADSIIVMDHDIEVQRVHTDSSNSDEELGMHASPHQQQQQQQQRQQAVIGSSGRGGPGHRGGAAPQQPTPEAAQDESDSETTGLLGGGSGKGAAAQQDAEKTRRVLAAVAAVSAGAGTGRRVKRLGAGAGAGADVQHTVNAHLDTDSAAALAAQKAMNMVQSSAGAGMAKGGAKRSGGGGGGGGPGGRALMRQPSALMAISNDRERAELIKNVSFLLMPQNGGHPHDTVTTDGEGGHSMGMGSFRRYFEGSFNLGFGGGAGGKGSTKRRFKASHFMGVKLLLRFTWPLVTLVALYAGMWVYEEGVTDRVGHFKHNSLYFGQVVNLIAQLNHGARSVLASGASCNASALGSALRYVDETSALINGYQDALLYGHAEAGVPPALAASNDLSRLMLSNGCDVPDMPSDCAPRDGFYHGLVGGGLQAALREYILLARHTLQVQVSRVGAAATSGGNCTPTDVQSDAVASLDAMAQVYLRTGFEHVLTLMLSLTGEQVSSFLSGHAAITAVAVLALLAVYFLFFLRAVKKMDRDIKRTRGTLLLFPTDVLAGVAAFVQLSGGLGADAGGGGGGGGGSFIMDSSPGRYR